MVLRIENGVCVVGYGMWDVRYVLVGMGCGMTTKSKEQGVKGEKYSDDLTAC